MKQFQTLSIRYHRTMIPREETNEMIPVMASVYSLQRGCRLRSRKGGTEKPYVAMEERCVEFTGQSLLWSLQRAPTPTP